MSRRAALLVVGFLSTACQVIVLRELAAALYGVELVYLLALGTWLVGTGVGALAAARGVSGPAGVRAGFVVVALLTAASVAATRAAPVWLGGLTGAYLPAWQQLAVVCMASVPLSTALGALFTSIARGDVEAGRALAAAYADESAGAMAGGVVVTMAFALGARTLSVAIACVGLAAMAATESVGTSKRGRPLVLVTIAVATAILLVPVARIDKVLSGWTRPHLVAVNDTPYGRVTISEAEGQVSVQLDNALWFDTEDTRAELLGHLAALAHAAPRDVVLLGGALDGTCRVLVLHAPRRLHVLELDRRTFDLVRARLPAARRPPFDDAVVRTTFDDPRRALAAEHDVDLVVVAMPEPESGAANRFYTREFFFRARNVLRPGGVIALRLALPENVLTRAAIARTASVAHALREAFGDVHLLPYGSSVIVLASNTAIETAADTWIRRFEQRGLRGELVSPALLRYVLENDRRATLAQAVAESDLPANSDALPVSYRYSTLAWLGRIAAEPGALVRPVAPGAAGEPVASSVDTRVWLTCGAVGGIVAIALRRWRSARRVLRVALAAAVGMALDGVLLLYYQVTRGILFEHVGLLVTGFMAGLVLGATIVGRWPGDRWNWLAAVGLAGVGVATAGVVLAGWGTMITVLALVTADGFFVAAMFAQAGAGDPLAASRRVPLLYAGDVLGGAVAALLVPTVMVPVLGLDVTAAAAGATALLCLAWR